MRGRHIYTMITNIRLAGNQSNRHHRTIIIKIDTINTLKISVKKTDIDLMLKWRGPMEEMPPNLGRVRPIFEHYPVDV